MEGGVQRPEVCFANAREAGRQCNVNVAGDVHRLEVGVVLNHRQLGFEGFRVGHNVFHGLQLGHIHACFCRHVQVGVAGAQTLFLVAGNGTAHAAFTPVVGRQGQVPVAKHAVELLQVVQRGAGGGQHVAPVIAKRVLLQVKVTAGGRHELPHARRLGAGDRLGVEGTFDVGQQGQFGGHAAPLQLFDDMEQVFAGALRHALHVVGAAGVPLLAVLHQFMLQVGHGKATPDAVPEVCRGGERCHPLAAGIGRRDGPQGPLGDDGGVRGATAGGCVVRGVAGHSRGSAGGGTARQPEHAYQADNVQKFHRNSFFQLRKAASTAIASLTSVCGA